MEKQVSPETPVTTKKKRWLPAVLLLVLLLIIAGAVFAGIEIGKKQPSQTPSEILFNQPTIGISTPTPDPTVGWKTYTNEQYKFSFKYPGNWEFAESKSKYQNTIDYLMVTLAKKENMSPLPVGGLPHIIINVVKTTDTKDFSFNQWTRVSGTKLVDGASAELREHISVDSKEAVFIKDGKTFEITSQGYNQDSLQNGVFDQILATFKFLDSSQTAGWKIYTNTQYGYEMKYPVSWVYDCSGQPCNSTWWVWFSSSEYRPEIQVAVKVRDLITPILTAEEYFKKESFFEVISTNWAKIDGNSAFGGIVKVGRGEAGISTERFLMVVKNLKLYQFELIQSQDSEKLDLSKMSIFDQILATFKFVEKRIISPTIASAEKISYLPKSSWSTYIDNIFGYQIQYPPGFKIGSYTKQGADAYFSNCFIKDPKTQNELCLSGFMIRGYQDYDRGSRRAWLSKKYSFYKPYYKDFIVDGKNALLVIEGNPGGSSESFIAIPNGTKMIVISQSGMAWDPDTEKLPDLSFTKEILSTFKFLE